MWSFFDEKGRVVEEEVWDNGKLITAKQYFYKTFSKGIKDTHQLINQGIYTKHYNAKKSKVMVKGGIKDGFYQGTWRFYDENGELSAEGNYENGLRQGVWKFYENGKLIKDGNFAQDEQVGWWRFYDKNEKVTQTINFD